jgi:hypothetical protein
MVTGSFLLPFYNMVCPLLNLSCSFIYLPAMLLIHVIRKVKNGLTQNDPGSGFHKNFFADAFQRLTICFGDQVKGDQVTVTCFHKLADCTGRPGLPP